MVHPHKKLDMREAFVVMPWYVTGDISIKETPLIHCTKCPFVQLWTEILCSLSVLLTLSSG